MALSWGRATRDKRLTGRAPFGYRNIITFVAALRHDGIVAPWVIGGLIDGRIFPTYVERVLVPGPRPAES